MKHTNTLKATRYMIDVVCKYDKSYVFLKFAASLVRTVFTYPMVILPGKLVDALLHVVGNKTSNPNEIPLVVLLTLATIVLPLLLSLFNYFVSLFIEKKQTRIMQKIEIDFYKHILLMDYETFENPEIASIRDRAQSTLYSATTTIDRVEQLFSAIITIIMLTSIIISLDIWTIVVIIAVTFFNSFFLSQYNKKHYEYKKDEITANRFLFAYGHIISDSLYAEEMKIYNSADFFLGKYKEAKENIDGLRLSDSKRAQTMYLKNAGVNFFQNVILYGMILYRVIANGLSIGNYSIYFATVSKFSNSVDTLVSSWMRLSNEKLYVQDMMNFLNYPLKQYTSGSLHVPQKGDLVFEFKNVSFKYPNTDTYVLKHLNVVINTNEKICLLGENGCGKSTLVKLLLRMYWINDGEILLNGISIYEYDYNEYLSMFSPILQNYGVYSVSLKENIILNDKNNQTEYSVFCKLCSLLSLDKLATKHEKGYDIQIGKMIYPDGIDLSGGEYQKMALARALFKDGRIFVLDEPTASIDPISEYNFYKDFDNLTKNKSVIFITHRLAAVKLADKIIVLNDGAVAECGTHAELYDKNGLYTEMFDKQAQFYLNTDNYNDTNE